MQDIKSKLVQIGALYTVVMLSVNSVSGVFHHSVVVAVSGCMRLIAIFTDWCCILLLINFSLDRLSNFMFLLCICQVEISALALHMQQSSDQLSEFVTEI